jgi:signal transduction histidine kinase
MCEFYCECTFDEVVKSRHDLVTQILTEQNAVKGMNHEVRTALNAIMGFAQILNSENVSPEEMKSYSGIIWQESEHLLFIFNELLNLLNLNIEYPVHSGSNPGCVI